MGIQEAVITCLMNYVGFEGRAQRPEYWWWMLFVLAGWIIIWSLGGFILGTDSGAGAVAGGLFLLMTFLPGLAVAVRRLHDTDRTGWWLLFMMLPVLGWGLLVYLFTRASTPGPNRFGNGIPILGML